MNQTPEHYKITPTLSVIDLIDHVTCAFVSKDEPIWAYAAVYYSHALKHLMRAGKKGPVKADIEKAKSWLDSLDSRPEFRLAARVHFAGVVKEAAHHLARSYSLPWFYTLVTLRLHLLDADDLEAVLQEIFVLEQKILRHEYLVSTCGLDFEWIAHTYTCKCSTQFERDKVVSLLASFDAFDVTSVFQSESKAWMVMGSYKDE